MGRKGILNSHVIPPSQHLQHPPIPLRPLPHVLLRQPSVRLRLSQLLRRKFLRITQNDARESLLLQPQHRPSDFPLIRPGAEMVENRIPNQFLQNPIPIGIEEEGFGVGDFLHQFYSKGHEGGTGEDLAEEVAAQEGFGGHAGERPGCWCCC